jgi:thiamine pyrophosphate-dependent acetolactate synthase large subunit-like protein
MSEIHGGKLTVDALIDKGVEMIFSLSGGHIFPLYDYAENSPIELFVTRHEQNAVFMAEAWARMTGDIGTALVTAGPGFGNALTAVANAYMANTPLVLISGVVGLAASETLDLQDMRQLPVIEPIVKKALCCQKTERIPEFIDMAYRIAKSGCPGPVYLEIPIDVWNGSVPAESVKKPVTCVESRPVDREGAEKLFELLQSSANPVLIAGSGAYYSGAGKELTAFIEKTGVPVLTAQLGRGLVPDTHPLCFESSVVIRPGAAFDAVATTDLVVLLGNRISFMYAKGDVFNPEAKKVQVDINQSEIGRNSSIDLGIVSDIKGFVEELNRLVDVSGNSDKLKQQFSPWVETLVAKNKEHKEMAAFNWQNDNIPIHHMRICAEVNNYLNREDDIVVGDGGDTQVWMSMTRTARAAGHYLESGLFGCLGVGLPYANAAKLKFPEKRVCLVTGDGSIGLNFMEFETAIRKKLPIVVVICNDKQWGMIRHAQEVKLGRVIKEGSEIGMVDYHLAVEALGGKGILVESPDEIKPALEEAFACGKPACINIMTDPVPISPGSVALASMGGVDVSKFFGG